MSGRTSSAAVGLALLALSVALLAGIGHASAPSLLVSAALGSGAGSLSCLARAIRGGGRS